MGRPRRYDNLPEGTMPTGTVLAQCEYINRHVLQRWVTRRVLTPAHSPTNGSGVHRGWSMEDIERVRVLDFLSTIYPAGLIPLDVVKASWNLMSRDGVPETLAIRPGANVRGIDGDDPLTDVTILVPTRKALT